MQFWQQCRKNFAKTQNIFCSKSGNVSKKFLSFGNFLSSQMKLLSTYVEGSVDIRAESSPSKARNFFWLNSKSDKRLEKIFQKLIFAQNVRLYKKNSVLRKQCQKFMWWICQQFLLTSRKGSKSKDNSEKVSEWSSG